MKFIARQLFFMLFLGNFLPSKVFPFPSFMITNNLGSPEFAQHYDPRIPCAIFASQVSSFLGWLHMYLFSPENSNVCLKSCFAVSLL